MAEKPHSVEIDLTAGSNGTKIRIDGVEVPQVRSFRLEAAVDSPSVLHLELVALAVKVRGDAGAVQEQTKDDWREHWEVEP